MSDPAPTIKCPRCGDVSDRPFDVQEKYCPTCHQFHENMPRGPGQAPPAQAHEAAPVHGPEANPPVHHDEVEGDRSEISS